ncbi:MULTISPECIES: creatininase family protein [unclassified Brenneria]|uniref:creatininase family protein n=1 Tax=unclassified Brenneria TaxID=2634434 RepID=UPI0029C320FE|nr:MULTISPECIES: creatininase family protein [unclassified Brenneria]MDX5627041.1 creatininase family protein [Brenneria sp. L3-3Z]MDX5693609.1 creatininase family protein [Brenneria sp. L4-2C]
MRIRDCHWQYIENYLRHDDRVVLPIGSTEQHAYLSLCVDAILAEEVGVAAAEPLGVPVYPAVPFGLAPYFMAYPGTISLRVSTYAALITDLLDSLSAHGFRRIMILNGHGGNQPAAAVAQEWAAQHAGHRVRFHNWWNAPKTWAKVKEIDPVASHASWMENFPITRLAHAPSPEGAKAMIDLDRLRLLDPAQTRGYLGDGNYGGDYQKPDETMGQLWQVAVDETRQLLEDGWA